MSKLKRFMGTGAVIKVLFAGSIAVINQPTSASSQTVQIARESTPVDKTARPQYAGGVG